MEDLLIQFILFESNMKKTLILLSVTLLFIVTACEENGLELPDNPVANVLKGAITENRTLTADQVWEIDGKTWVESGVTLTIEPGTIIKGRSGVETNASALIIARGGMINAAGTATAPIIFTTIDDNIEVGQLTGTNLTKEDKELWGGLIILGNAPISAENGDTETQIEGIPAEEAYGKFGGTDASDNSGILKYVSIRHGGVSIGDGNEINGLTLGGVGTGTVIDHIEVFATLDDGIEFFGGTVNVTNAIVSYQGDDGIDIDMNYAGEVDNFVVIHGGADTDEGLEIDGPEGSTYTDGLFTLKNGTIISADGAGTPADLKAKAQGNLIDLIFSGYTTGKDVLKLRASYSDNCVNAKEDAFTHLTDTQATLVVSSTNVEGVSVYSGSLADDESPCEVSAADQTAAEGKVIKDINAAGASTATFASWTAVSIKGFLN